MRRLAAFSLVALLTACALADAPVDGKINALIAKLADPEPAERAVAFEDLKKLGAEAVPALRRAVRHPQPNIADSAAQLLLGGLWYTSKDPAEFRNIVTPYGRLTPEQRAERVKLIILRRLDQFPKLVARVLMRDPSDEVGWRALQGVDGDADWDAALSAQKLEDLTPALRLQLAKSKDRAGDHDVAATLARQVLDAIREDPNVPIAGLQYAVQLVVEAESASGRFEQAAGYLRDYMARTGLGGQSEVIDQLLALHMRHGPLPGLADDIKRADTQGEPHGTIALALMADRVGLPLAGSTLLSAALGERTGESPVDRAARLDDIGEWLGPKRNPIKARTLTDEAAARVFEQIAASDETTLKNRVMLAYLRLSDLHFRIGHMQLAGDALQRAIDRQDGPLVLQRPNGQVESWPMEEEQAQVARCYLLDARARGDQEAIKKHAKALIASGSTDSTIFLDALPSLTETASAEEVDLYFDRVFQRAEARVIEMPAEPQFLNDIAWLCARSGRKLDKAVEWAERAVKLLPESAYLDTLAEAKFRSGKIKEAIELETRALRSQPDDEAFMRQQLERFQRAATTRPND